MRILLVEDDEMIGSALRTALEDAAYAVEWVTDGAAAQGALAGADIHALLLDLGLPDRDGFDVLACIREAGNAVPVIVITARDEVEARVRGLDLGADDYVVKPFALKELLARLRAVVRRQAGRASTVLSNGDVSLDPASHVSGTRSRCCGLRRRDRRRGARAAGG